MDGIFIRKKFNIDVFLLTLFGLFSIGFFAFLKFVKQETEGAVFIFLFLGIGMCLCALLIWRWNFGAFVHIDESSVKAKYGWFGRFDLKFSEIDFVLAQGMALSIQKKDGRIYTVMGLVNAADLYFAINPHVDFSVTEQPSALIESLRALKSVRKRDIIVSVFAILLMFVNLFIMVFLTYGKDTNEFNGADWTVMKVFIIADVITFIIGLYFAIRSGKKAIPLEKLKYTVRRRLIETSGLLPGNAVKVLTDEFYVVRITVFGYPNDDSVYFIAEAVDQNYNLVVTYESEVFESIDEILEDFNDGTDITDKFLQ